MQRGNTHRVSISNEVAPTAALRDHLGVNPGQDGVLGNPYEGGELGVVKLVHLETD